MILTTTPITFTLGQLVAILLGICGGIVTISAAVTVLIKTAQKLKAPELKQDERITALEKKIEQHDKFFDNDNRRLVEMERGNIVMQQAMLALLSHALNGNDVDSLKHAKQHLEKYLISRGGGLDEVNKPNI